MPGPSNSKTFVHSGSSEIPIHSRDIDDLLTAGGAQGLDGHASRRGVDDVEGGVFDSTVMRHFLTEALAVAALSISMASAPFAARLVAPACSAEARPARERSTFAAAVPVPSVARGTQGERTVTARPTADHESQRIHTPPEQERGGRVDEDT